MAQNHETAPETDGKIVKGNITEYRNFDLLRAEIEEHPDGDFELPIKGAPRGVTHGSVIELAEEFDGATLFTKTRQPFVITGADFRFQSLHDVADVMETLGAGCICDTLKRDDGTIHLGYQFD